MTIYDYDNFDDLEEFDTETFFEEMFENNPEFEAYSAMLKKINKLKKRSYKSRDFDFDFDTVTVTRFFMNSNVSIQSNTFTLLININEDKMYTQDGITIIVTKRTLIIQSGNDLYYLNLKGALHFYVKHVTRENRK